MDCAVIRFLHPIGALLAGARSKAWLEVSSSRERATVQPADGDDWLQSRWKSCPGGYLDQGATRQPAGAFGTRQGRYFELDLVAPAIEGNYHLEVTVAHSKLSVPVRVVNATARASMTDGIQPLSYAWGTDRGLPAHRYYLEDFLESHRLDVRGACLEFQEALYAPRYGGRNIHKLDILHIDDSNPAATLVADLTRANDLPDDTFDCIVCTHVLHVIYAVEKAVKELHRILAPGGVLLAAVPQCSMQDPRYGELWRFTSEGLRRVLTSAFPPEAVTVHAYGNSLIAAGELRGLVASEFTPDELNTHDAWFAVEICARAVKDR